MDKVSLAANGDSVNQENGRGILSLDYEGWYYLVVEGTLGGSTTVTPFIRPKGSSVWDNIDRYGTTSNLVFNSSSRRVVLVPGNCEIKLVVANYSGSSSVVARRIRATKGA